MTNENYEIDAKTKDFMSGLILNCQAGRNRTLSAMVSCEGSDEFNKFLVLNEAILSYVRKLLLNGSNRSIEVEYESGKSITFSDTKEHGIVLSAKAITPITSVLFPFYETIYSTLRATKGLVSVELPKTHVDYLKWVLEIHTDIPDKKVNRALYTLLCVLEDKGLDEWGVARQDDYVLELARAAGMKILRMGYKHEEYPERVQVFETDATATLVLKELCSWINMGREDRQSLLTKKELLSR